MAVRGIVLQVLLKNDILRSASHIGLQSTRVLERTDDHTVIFAGRWVPGGWAATLLAPEMWSSSAPGGPCLQRGCTWRLVSPSDSVDFFCLHSA